MSLSNVKNEDKFYTGRVIMGIDSESKAQEMTIQEIEGKKKPNWDEDTNQEYFARVKDKAQLMAKKIISKAMADAEQLKIKAQEEGYAEGLSKAAIEAEQHITESTRSLGQTLSGIQENSHKILLAQSTDAVSLILMVIEKTLAVEMGERRQEILEALLNEALSLIHSQTGLVVKVSPAVQEIISPLLEQAQKEYPSLANWRIKNDPTMENGGVILETEDEMVDNTVTSRWEGVQEILAQLSPGSGDPDG